MEQNGTSGENGSKPSEAECIAYNESESLEGPRPFNLVGERFHIEDFDASRPHRAPWRLSADLDAKGYLSFEIWGGDFIGGAGVNMADDFICQIDNAEPDTCLALDLEEFWESVEKGGRQGLIDSDEDSLEEEEVFRALANMKTAKTAALMVTAPDMLKLLEEIEESGAILDPELGLKITRTLHKANGEMKKEYYVNGSSKVTV